jgi:hypothetical protein
MHLYFRKSFYILLLFIGQFLFSKVIFVDDDSTLGGDGTSWATAHKYLQDALAVAEYGDEIWVAEGTYKPDQGRGQTSGNREATFSLKSGVNMIGGFRGDEVHNNPNGDINFTILSGKISNNETYWSLHVVSAITVVDSTIQGFMITCGNSNGTEDFAVGSGLFNKLGELTVKSCIFENCKSAGSISQKHLGSALYSSGTAIIESCIFSENANSALSLSGNANVNSCLFLKSGIGLAISTCNLIVRNSTFFGPFDNQYGILRNHDSGSPNPVVLNCIFNSAKIEARRTLTSPLYSQPYWTSKKTIIQSIPEAYPGDPNAVIGIEFAPNIFIDPNDIDFLKWRKTHPPPFETSSDILIFTDSDTVSQDLRNDWRVIDYNGQVFVNSANPIGPDQRWFTVDDGLNLIASSPAMNSGSNGHLYENEISYISGKRKNFVSILDLMGNNRVNGSSVDIGAYEYYFVSQYNVSAKNSSSGTISGAGLYYQGAEVTLQANPSSGYSFLKWGGDLDSALNPLKITIGTNLSVSAKFIPTSIFNLVQDATNPVSDWHVNSWLGTFFASNSSWIYHSPLGWLYVHPVDDASYWMWSDKHGWMWIHSLYFPYLYSNDIATWLRLDTSTGLISVFSKSKESWNDYYIYNVFVSSEPKTAGAVLGDGNYVIGTLASLNATPDVYHTFLHWMNGNQIVSTDHNYSFVVDENVSLVAIFEPKRPLEEMAEFTLEVSPANASDFIIYDSDSNLLDKNTSFSVPVGEVLTIRPSYGYDYYFSHWEMPNGDVFSDEQISIEVNSSTSLSLKLLKSLKLSLQTVGATASHFKLEPESDIPIYFEDLASPNVSYWKPNSKIKVNTFASGYKSNELPSPWVRKGTISNSFVLEFQITEDTELIAAWPE